MTVYKFIKSYELIYNLGIPDKRCNYPNKITKTSAFPTTIGKRKRNTTWPG
jgi:hypothetical protein